VCCGACVDIGRNQKTVLSKQLDSGEIQILVRQTKQTNKLCVCVCIKFWNFMPTFVVICLVACMVGAIIGALHGTSWIPTRWFHPIESGPHGRDYCIKTAKSLAKLNLHTVVAKHS